MYVNSSYLTLTPVHAGKLVALVDDLLLAVPTGKADGAGAGVVLAGVEAGGPVVARPVVGAEVEVFVAHLTSPALRTFAGPRLGAGAVDTAGVDLTVVAEFTFPALVTSEDGKELVQFRHFITIRKLRQWIKFGCNKTRNMFMMFSTLGYMWRVAQWPM